MTPPVFRVRLVGLLRRAFVAIALMFTVIAGPRSGASGQGYKPNAGYVPDSETAVKIAEAVLIPVYGKEKIESERPFKATIENGVWTVSGTLRCSDGKGGTTTMCVGGTAEVKLSKTDGRILKMIHYK